MNNFQCSAIAREVIHIQVEAENKKEAAEKAMNLFKEHGDLVLFKSVGGCGQVQMRRISMRKSKSSWNSRKDPHIGMNLSSLQ